jgi:hypothetical protein
MIIDTTAPDLRTVRGRLTDDSGPAAGGIAVRAIARDGGNELTLGETTTGDDGAYELAYRVMPMGSGLVVRAVEATGHVLGESPPRFVLDDADTVDLVVARDGAADAVRLAHPDLSFAPTATVAAANTTIGAHVSERLNARLRSEVRQLIGAVSPDVDRAVAASMARMDWSDAAERSLGEVARTVFDAADVDAREIAARLAAAPEVPVAEVLQLHAPLGSNPVLAASLARARAIEYTRIAGLSGATSRAVVDDGPSGSLRSAAADVTDDETATLSEVMALGALTGDNLPLVSAVRQRGDATPSALAALSGTDWAQLIDETGVPVPPGHDVRSYADHLAFGLETAFPTEALAARAGDDDVAGYVAANPGVDLRRVDLVQSNGRPHSRALAVDSGEPPELRAKLRAQQRVLALADTTDARVTLLRGGFDSAHKIAGRSEQEFVEASGLPRGEARAVYARAQETALVAANAFGAINDASRGLFDKLAVGNVSPDLVNDLRRIDGFSDLFGPQDFCDCPHCRSVLGPPAYFTDLMHFVETNVSRPVFIKPGKTTHPLYLKNRRPDLWTLPVTCANTNTLVPYLTIVNEVLEAYLSKVVDGDIYATLANAATKVSFRVPFDLPLAELGVYLGHFGLTPADVYRRLRQPDNKVFRARLNLSPVEAAAITTPDPTGVLARLGSPTSLTDYAVPRFLRQTGLERNQLDDVLHMQFNKDLNNVVVVEQRPVGELQNFPEVLQGLTNARVDFLHRFLRLRRSTEWSVEQLDLLLVSLRAAGLIGNELDNAVIAQLGQLVELQQALHLDVEELASWISLAPVSRSFPKQPATSDRRLYERLFDLRALFGVKDPASGELNQTFTYHHYSMNTNTPTDTTIDPKTPHILGALGITETELLQLLAMLRQDIPFDANGSTTLDRPRLSLLFRHISIARAMGLGIEDLVRTQQLVFPGTKPVATTLTQVRQLIEFGEWLRSSPFSTAGLLFILQGVETATVKYATDRATVAQIVEASKIGGRVDLNLLRTRLATNFNVTVAALDDLLAWTSANLGGASARSAIADTPSDVDQILAVVQGLERIAKLFAALQFDAATVDYLTRHKDAVGIVNLRSITLTHAVALTQYRSLAKLGDGAEAKVQAVLDAYMAAGAKVPPGADRVRLADLWQVDVSLLDSVVVAVPLPAVAVDAVARIGEILATLALLGVHAFSLQKLGNDQDYAALVAARDVAKGAFGAKYSDVETRAEKLAPYEDRINVIKRDALCDYLIGRQPELKFENRGDIYSYFLLDVEMSGEFRISRVVAAISSVQLYVHRSLLNLEQSDPALNPNIPDVHVEPAMVPAEEWEWRQNYRVWEANRKVFLFPESYLDPNLRDTKSPMFESLEDNLLAQRITDDSANQAYHRYLTEFAEVSHLRMVGTYFDAEEGSYYLIARTQQDPPQFYLRKWHRQITWTPWEKIELAIEAPYVSAQVLHGRLYLFWVEGQVRDRTTFSGGSSQFQFYDVKVNLVYSSRGPDGKWLSPQKVAWLLPSPSENPFAKSQVFTDAVLTEMELSKTYRKAYPNKVGNLIILRYENVQVVNAKFERALDLFQNRLMNKGSGPNFGIFPLVRLYSSGSTAQLGVENVQLLSESVLDRVIETPLNGSTPGSLITTAFPYRTTSVTDPTRDYVMHVVHGRYPESVFTVADQQFLIHSLPAGGPTVAKRELVRLTTSVGDAFGQAFGLGGIENLLTLQTQQLPEKPLGFTLTDQVQLRPPTESTTHLDFRGAYGEYFRELFLHIPWLIANHLNANLKFEEAKAWYERIFDPTASASALDKTPTDRNWRYMEFRDVTMPKLRDLLSDPATLEAYKKDPFNPHAIARLRPSAFQKAIVMQYIDNLLDWGDALFAQDNIESINEATMLYILANDILGERPVKLGAHDTTADADLTYDRLGPAIDAGSEFLVVLENLALAAGANGDGVSVASTPELGRLEAVAAERSQRDASLRQLEDGAPITRFPAVSLAAQSTLAFRVPPNEELLKYWDRVEDRLFKIRHNLSLNGVRRQLELFQAPINPAALVRAKAAGLSLEDAIAGVTAALPPYRFAQLLDRAQKATGMVQSFGAVLLSALEKKDVEELTLLRSVHERELLRLTRDAKAQQVREAKVQLQSTIEATVNVENRIAYYSGLIETGLIGWEVAQQATRHSATALKVAESAVHLSAAIGYLIPELGSPFAMKYGGQALGHSFTEFAAWTTSMASILDAVSASAGLEGGFQRREEEWRQQLAVTEQELLQVEQQRLAAEIHVALAEQDEKTHLASMEHSEELETFYKEKFTGLGLYNYLATTLSRLHREAYSVAHELALMAERAHRFELDDDQATFIAQDNWQFDKAGLLAGDRLSLQLQRLEHAHLTGNIRQYEMTQSFSLAQLDPRTLLTLRETGSAEFTVPEIVFDLAYPGQYKRLIKSVQLTIPCVAGPYTNVGAKLTLKQSKVRRAPTTAPNALVQVPVQTTASIATNTAQHDGGLFELNFRDERYLPFEGAGAVSTWGLELPAQLRLFDYDSISDVIVHISYTALDDGAFRQSVESAIAGALTQHASTVGLHRLFSLRHDFPSVFHRLLHTEGAQTVTFELGAQHFPAFLSDRTITAGGAAVYLQPAGNDPVDTAGLALKVNGTTTGPFSTMPKTNLRTADVAVTGPALTPWTVEVTTGELAPDKVSDLYLLINYTV